MIVGTKFCRSLVLSTFIAVREFLSLPSCLFSPATLSRLYTSSSRASFAMENFNQHLLLLFRRGCPATDLEDEAKALTWLAVVEDMLVRS